jgi:hypothetical protein
MKMLLLSTVFVFFRQRAGTFFVLLGILFGFLSSVEHHAFAVFFLTGSNGMAYLFAIWLLYALLCAQFVVTIWKQPEYTFIYRARMWPSLMRLRRFVLMAFGLLQPLLYYGIYLLTIAVQDDILQRLWPIFPFYLILSVIIILSAEWRIRNPVLYVPVKSRAYIRWPFRRPVSWIYWSFEWLFRERGVTLLAGKLGAMLVAAGTMLYYSTDIYDIRLPAVGLSLAYLLNVGLSLELYQWESQVWLWGRSLPVPARVRFGRMIVLHALLIVPETLVAVRNAPLSFFEVMQLYFLGLGILVTSHLYFYKAGGLPESGMQVFLFGFAALTVVILYKVPLLVIAGCFLLVSVYFYPRWYKQ